MFKFFSNWHKGKDKNKIDESFKDNENLLNMDFVSVDDQYNNNILPQQDAEYVKIRTREFDNGTAEESMNSDSYDNTNSNTINTISMAYALSKFKQNGLQNHSQYESNKETRELNDKFLQEDLKDLEPLTRQHKSWHITDDGDTNLSNENLENADNNLNYLELIDKANNFILEKQEGTVLMRYKFDDSDKTNYISNNKRKMKRKMKYGITSRNRHSL